MNILFLEPYFTGSHASWAKQYKKYSKHNIHIMSMEGRFWKWRMHGGAVHMANEFNKLNFKPDLIFATDMLDFSTFLALTRQKTYNVKTALYFHENQLSYPWSPNDQDTKNNRDVHYGFINYTSSLSSDINLFNSKYHMDSFLDALECTLKRFPDYNTLDSFEILKQKCHVLNLGLELSKFDNIKFEKTKKPLVVWNHRWEYDKNAEDFFNALFEIKNQGIDFEVAVLGESFGKSPKIFDVAKEKLKENIVAWGHQDSFEDYAAWLKKADIAPVTSNQEFFGISFMEAIYNDCYPILPNRLTYPELVDISTYPHIFYNSYEEFLEKLKTAILNINSIRNTSYKHIAKKYQWEKMSLIYDDLLENIAFS